MGDTPRFLMLDAQPWGWTLSHAEVVCPPPQLSQPFPVPYSPLGKLMRGRGSAQSMAAGTTTPQSRRRAAGMAGGGRDAPQEGPTTIPAGRARVRAHAAELCDFTRRKQNRGSSTKRRCGGWGGLCTPSHTWPPPSLGTNLPLLHRHQRHPLPWGLLHQNL